ncbi:uncharacterized protein MKK02DRAFT_43034 [Dioszegia hungarica]|uniref:Uncharacterized protein n=1 Tax=Dioszegia hungarica TaxID=4972 RepID=A0AA38HDD4_9TREE|nr:uncharacterized protein MKK02DRAFT_43034 [Dioszegia hungarica]KAI9638635.1 hypothetical protein MKK02DRAFT_43034 [Dioszegia hungarica]
MRPSTSLFGASRLPLTPKRANKDFYKGTRQSYVPGGGHRTGPPGKHVVQGKAKYRLLDEKVRYFVGPGPEVLANTNLKPYVSTQIPRISDSKIASSSTTPLPSFSPNAIPSSAESRFSTADFTKFSRRYQRASLEERQALIQNSRREWWEAMRGRFGGDEAAREERITQSVEGRVAGSA